MERIRNILLILILIILTSCANDSPDTLRFAVPGLAQNFDPRFATDAASERINHLLHCSLVRFDSEQRPQASIATWQVVTPTLYRFILDSQATFWNGNKVTAADVVETYLFVADKQNASPHRSTLALIKQVNHVDVETVEFELTRADPLFPSYLVIGIQPRELIRSQSVLHREPMGCGNFRLISHDEEKTIIEQRQSGRRVAFLRSQDPSTRVLKLLKGEVDMLQGDLSPQLVDYLARQDGVQVSRQRGSNFTYLGFNLQDKDTGNLLIRKAISHAINRAEIIHYVFHGRARAAHGLFPAEHWLAAAADLAQIEYDPHKSKMLLAQAGYDKNQRLQLTYKTSSDPFRIRVATIIQQQLAKVGIELAIKSYDWGTFYGDIKAGNFQLYSLTWVGLKTPDSYRYLFHSDSIPPNGANRGRFFSAAADEFIEKAEFLSSQQQQLPYYHQLQQLLLEQLPYVPLWYEDQVAVTRGKARDYRVASDGNYDGLETLSWLNMTHAD